VPLHQKCEPEPRRAEQLLKDSLGFPAPQLTLTVHDAGIEPPISSAMHIRQSRGPNISRSAAWKE
jgi:hypothetical protein